MGLGSVMYTEEGKLRGSCFRVRKKAILGTVRAVEQEREGYRSGVECAYRWFGVMVGNPKGCEAI